MDMPEAELYERGLAFWPYRRSLELVLERVKHLAPTSGRVLDIMCGPGYLLNQMQKTRPDLKLTGVDIEARYVEYGRMTYPSIEFLLGDIVNWEAEDKFDMVLCTGALHHVSYEEQPLAVENIVSLLRPSGYAIISDSYVGNYETESERRQRAAELGSEYYFATRANGAPDDVLAATLDILVNDVRMDEFKTSVARRMPILNCHFGSIETTKVWREVGYAYGDYIHVCTPR